jgi:CBS domain containing-hemolysin-like protein/mannitol/fructose-specific phosphotransferase system IIA component (Ntr-type)
MVLILFAVAALLLLLINAFFVLAEFAAVRIRGSRIEELVDQGARGARVASHVHQHLDSYLSMCQVGITFASIALGSVGERAAAELLRPHLGWSGHLSDATAHTLASILAVAGVGVMHVLFGEQVPKLIAIREADRAALWTAQPLRLAGLICYPPLWLLTSVSRLILRGLGLPATSGHEHHSEDELRIILASFQSGGQISFRRLLFLENIFDLGDLRVRDAMRPRSQVRVLHTGVHWIDTMQFIQVWRFSRYPLLDGESDLPIGMVHIKDLCFSSTPVEQRDLRAIMRPCITTSEGASLESLLAAMQRRRIHAAVVTDRDGRWTGFITMEDIIEEIIGTVEDEFASEAPLSLADVLSADRIFLDLVAPSLAGAIQQVCARLPSAALPLPAEAVTRAVLERERLASTYLGKGLAMPHARLAGLARSLLVILRARTGFPQESHPEPIRLAFLLLTPAGQPRVHQRLQARIAQLLESSDYVQDRLFAATTPEEVLDIIRTGEQASLG